MSDSTRVWSKVQELSLFPFVRDLEEYKRLTCDGIAEGLRHFRDKPITNPRIDHYLDAHRLIFGAVYPWAGEHRTPGQEVSVGKHSCCFSSCIPLDSKIHDEQCRRIANGSDNPLLLASFSHIRALRIHPFLDGNGRSARVVCDSLLRETVGPKYRIGAWTPEYKAVFAAAVEENDLGPIMRNLAERSPERLSAFAPKSECISPFDLKPGDYTKRHAEKAKSEGLDSFVAATRLHEGVQLKASSLDDETPLDGPSKGARGSGSIRDTPSL